MKVPIIIKTPEELLKNIKNGIFDILENEEAIERNEIEW